jgi:opacity protein-like surface antigen
MSYRSFTLGLLAAASLVGPLAALGTAQAADLDGFYGDAPPPEQETKVEFGSGWYIRGDIGATRLPSIKTINPSLPTATNQTPPSAPVLNIDQGSNVGYVGSLAGGYQFNHWFRADLMADIHQPVASSAVSGNGNVFCATGVSYPNATTNAAGTINYGAPSYANGGCTGNYKTNLKSYDVLVNGYVDLGTWHRVTPYVGAGIGMSFGHYQSSSTYIQGNNQPYQISYFDPKYSSTFYPNFDRSSSGTYYSFAWALMGGFAFDVYDHTKLDIGYRYLNLGRIPGLSGNLTSQEVRAGLRYMIDN